MKLLIIEDELIFRTHLKMQIENAQLFEDIQETDEVNEALTLFKDLEPTHVILDINLGQKIGGLELAKIFKKMSDARIIFISAYNDLETMVAVAKIDPFAFLNKPVNFDILLSLLQEN